MINRPIGPSDFSKPTNSRNERVRRLGDAPAASNGRVRENRKTQSSVKGTVDSRDVHHSDALREAIGQLMETSQDGAIRLSRVESARQKNAEGAYDRREVLASVVDRLLEKWRI